MPLLSLLFYCISFVIIIILTNGNAPVYLIIAIAILLAGWTVSTITEFTNKKIESAIRDFQSKIADDTNNKMDNLIQAIRELKEK